MDRIKASFRYCASCQLFVGRACCWNPDAVACVVDAPLTALITTAPAAVLAGGPNETAARRAVAELAASIGALGQLRDAVERVPQWEDDRDIRLRAWDDAWSATGWLIARAETSRDAAAKALWRAPAQAVPPTTEELNGQLLSLEEQYARARSTVEAGLIAAGRSLGPAALKTPVAARWRDSAILAGALGAVAVLAFGTAALLQLGYLDPFASSGAAVAPDGEGAVLGGGGGPTQSSAPAFVPSSNPVPTVVAQLTFDELPVGPLAGATGEIGPVAGGPEVVSFPSPFDRSVRATGTGTHRFCIPASALDEGSIRFDMDLYPEAPMDAGRLLLSMAPPGAAATSASVPLGMLAELPAEAWHHLRAVWTPSQPVTITIGDLARGEIQTGILPPARDGPAVEGAVCIALTGMPADAVLLLDNLQVHQ